MKIEDETSTREEMCDISAERNNLVSLGEIPGLVFSEIAPFSARSYFS